MVNKLSPIPFTACLTEGGIGLTFTCRAVIIMGELREAFLHIFFSSRALIGGSILGSSPNFASNIKQIKTTQHLFPLKSSENVWFSNYFRGNTS